MGRRIYGYNTKKVTVKLGPPDVSNNSSSAKIPKSNNAK
jgi:hypothetical protein